MKPTRGNAFDEDRAVQAINSAHTALLKIRETQGKWEDINTVGMSEDDWKKGSIVIAEALLCFLIPNVKLPKQFGNLKIKEANLREDIEALLGFAAEGVYHSFPYLAAETSFTDTASLLLSCFAYIMYEKSAIPEKIKVDYRDAIGDAARSLLKFLRESAANPTKGTHAWAPTNICEYSSLGVKKKSMPLYSSYHTSLVLRGLSDANDLLGLLKDSERNNIEELMEAGIKGIAETYDSRPPLFARNLSNSERNIIHSIFAVEGLLCFPTILDGNEQLKTNLVECVRNIVEAIGPDLKGLVNYDQNVTWPYAYTMKKDLQKMELIIEDRSTLGSLVNVFCGALRYLPPGEEVERTYAVIDNLVGEFYARRDSKENLWVREGIRIYYTMRMIESLTLCLSQRPEQELNFSKRILARTLADALSSEEVIWQITERISKDLGPLSDE